MSVDDRPLMTEGEFRGRVLAKLEDLAQRMERLEEFMARAADHESRIRSLEQRMDLHEQRRWSGSWHVWALLVAAATAVANILSLVMHAK
jgi:hypothetical protein